MSTTQLLDLLIVAYAALAVWITVIRDVRELRATTALLATRRPPGRIPEPLHVLGATEGALP